ncbi:hypothetical protein Tco_1368215 [Tanacetum coccineum]
MLAIQEEEGKGSGHPSEPQPPPSTAQPINEEPIPNVTGEPIPNVPDEAVYVEWDDRVERTTTTAASLDVEQASGGSPRCQEAMGGSIAQTRSERKVESLEADMKQTKKVYGAAYTKLIKKVKKLEKTIKSNQARRRAKIMVSDDEEDLEDSSKQGRMIDEINQDAGVTLVIPTHSQEDQHEDQLGVFSATKVLADAAKENVHTYTRRRRAVSTGSGRISTASRLFSTAEESVSTVGASMPVSTACMVQVVNISIPSPVVVKDKSKAAVRLQEELDEEERQRMARVHEKAKAKRKKHMTQAQQRNYMINYIKHMGSHTLQQLKRYSFDELKELFETTMKNVNTFVPMETEDRGRASELAAGSSQAIIIVSAEVGSSKRDAEA